MNRAVGARKKKELLFGTHHHLWVTFLNTGQLDPWHFRLFCIPDSNDFWWTRTPLAVTMSGVKSSFMVTMHWIPETQHICHSKRKQRQPLEITCCGLEQWLVAIVPWWTPFRFERLEVAKRLGRLRGKNLVSDKEEGETRTTIGSHRNNVLVRSFYEREGRL